MGAFDEQLQNPSYLKGQGNQAPAATRADMGLVRAYAQVDHTYAFQPAIGISGAADEVCRAQQRLAQEFMLNPGFGGLAGLDKTVLVRFLRFGDAPSTPISPIFLAPLPLYFRDICPDQLSLPVAAAHQRLSFARATGYIPFGMDQALAIAFESKQGGAHSHLRCLEVNSQGRPREIVGLDVLSMIRAPGGRAAADLAQADLDREASQWRQQLYWSEQDQVTYDATQRRRIASTVQLLKKMVGSHKGSTTGKGSRRNIRSCEGVTPIKLEETLLSAGQWQPYPLPKSLERPVNFRVWIHPANCRILIYRDDTIETVDCNSQRQFMEELSELRGRYWPLGSPASIAKGKWIDQDRLILCPPTWTTVLVENIAQEQGELPMVMAISDEAMKRLPENTEVEVEARSFTTDLLDERTFGNVHLYACRQGRGRKAIRWWFAY